MNCPSRTDEPLESDGWNQNPPALAADLTTRQDLNGISNLRTLRSSEISLSEVEVSNLREGGSSYHLPPENLRAAPHPLNEGKSFEEVATSPPPQSLGMSSSTTHEPSPPASPLWNTFFSCLQQVGKVLAKYIKFIGPGFMVSVAYIDPGNYSTDIAAGAATRFKLLFVILMSNVFAILLQSLALRLGTVTGLNLAEHCRAHLPRWLNMILYIMGETAIIATDIAEVSFQPSIKFTLQTVC